MDPLLQAILSSRDPSRLVQEMRPEWAARESGANRVGGYPDVGPAPEVSPVYEGRASAAYERSKEPMAGKRSFIKQFADAFMSLGDPRAQAELPKAREVGETMWNPVFGGAGILTNAANSPVLLKSLKQAMEAKAKGWPSQKVWDKFGWDQNAAGQWVRQIPDDSLRLTARAQEAVGGGAPMKEVPLNQAIDWPELFKTHPETAQLLTTIGKGDFAGSYLPRIAQGGARMKLQGQNPAQVLEALQHEGSHAVSDVAGMPAGSNPAASTLADIMRVKSTPTSVKDLEDPAFAAYWRQAGEAGARNESARFVDQDLRKLAPSLTEDVPRMLQTVKFLQETSPQLAVIKGPWKGGIDKQIEKQMPRLERLAEETFRTAKPKQLKGEPQEVTPLLKSVASQPSIKHFLGQEEARYGADVYEQGPYPFNLGGVSSEYASPEEARRAALIYVLNKLRAQDPKGGEWRKAIKPQISEFASPESARKSWRILERKE